ncbi:MAG: HAD superfamily hydrolase (TIGR01509 family) [Limisphaerales bacterium]|jgi:HAD superfamily hydrolase (TIGR01509 family)
MKFEGILWDNDGILVDTEQYYYKATTEVMAEEGTPLTEEDFYEHFLKGNKGAWHLIPGLTETRLVELRAIRDKRYSNFLKTEEIILDGAEEVLDQLYGKLPMGIVTSSMKHHFEMIHSRTGFLKYFDFILANGDYARSKPNPDPYLAGLEKIGTDPKKTLVIEDSERGLLAAKAAGLTCWVIPTGLTEKGDFSVADRRLNSILELPDLLLI